MPRVALISFLLVGLLTMVVSRGSSSSPLKYKVVFVEEVPMTEDHYSLVLFISSKTRLQRVEDFQRMVCKLLSELELRKLGFEGLRHDHIDQYSGFAIRIYYDFDDYNPYGGDRIPDKVTPKVMERYLGAYNFNGTKGTGVLRLKGRQPEYTTHMVFCSQGPETDKRKGIGESLH